MADYLSDLNTDNYVSQSLGFQPTPYGGLTVAGNLAPVGIAPVATATTVPVMNTTPTYAVNQIGTMSTGNNNMTPWQTNPAINISGTQGSSGGGLLSSLGIGGQGGGFMGLLTGTPELPFDPKTFADVPYEQAVKMSLANQSAMQGAGPGLLDVGMGLLNAYNVFNQIKMQKEYLGMAKEQLAVAKEQWGMTKDEVSRIAKVRNNLNAGYQHGNYGTSPQSKTYA